MGSGTTTPNNQHSLPGNLPETSTEWPALLGRMLEDLSRVIRLELQLLEARIAPSLTTIVDRAIASLVILGASAIGALFLLAALVLFLHERALMQWWECLGIGGVVAFCCGLVAYVSLRARAE
jgi:hypothetical protein